jgi:hypothetical protein
MKLNGILMHPMFDMFHMVDLHKFYSILIILMLVNNISLGSDAHLSS